MEFWKLNVVKERFVAKIDAQLRIKGARVTRMTDGEWRVAVSYEWTCKGSSDAISFIPQTIRSCSSSPDVPAIAARHLSRWKEWRVIATLRHAVRKDRYIQQQPFKFEQD
jgi:hypothetical protein